MACFLFFAMRALHSILGIFFYQKSTMSLEQTEGRVEQIFVERCDYVHALHSKTTLSGKTFLLKRRVS